MKQEFLDFLNTLMEASPEIKPSENVCEFIKLIQDDNTTKGVEKVSEKGKSILTFLQEHQETRIWKAKDIAEKMGIGSRGVSGSMRKLVTDGYCEKIGKDPISYALTEKGKNYKD